MEGKFLTQWENFIVVKAVLGRDTLQASVKNHLFFAVIFIFWKYRWRQPRRDKKLLIPT